jgi:glycosyltransferase involved in cell wall biosynthesis
MPQARAGGETGTRVTALIPVLYSEPQLGQTLQGLGRLRDALDLEILVVVDVPHPEREASARAQNDEVVAAAGARVIYRIGERGFGSALRRGFAEATGDVMIPVMGDASEDPHDIVRLQAALGDRWDVVAGSRYMKGGGIVGQTPKQRLSQFYSVLCRLGGGPDIHDISNAFKAYRRSVVEEVHTVSESFDISVELTLKAHRAGFRIGEIPTVWTNRVQGHSNFSIPRELRRYGRWLLLSMRPRRQGDRGRVDAATGRAHLP